MQWVLFARIYRKKTSVYWLSERIPTHTYKELYFDWTEKKRKTLLERTFHENIKDHQIDYLALFLYLYIYIFLSVQSKTENRK